MIRHADVDDAPAIAELHIASWRAAYAAELPAWFLAAQALQERTDRWRQRIATGASAVLLDMDGQVLRAFCASGPTACADLDPARAWEVTNLHVRPDLRRKGVGGPLFEAARELGAQSGRSSLVLWVVATNAPARRFYERHGLRADGARQVHEVAPGVALDEVRYAGDIGPLAG